MDGIELAGVEKAITGDGCELGGDDRGLEWWRAGMLEEEEIVDGCGPAFVKSTLARQARRRSLHPLYRVLQCYIA